MQRFEQFELLLIKGIVWNLDIAVFKGKEIRKTIYKDERWFSVSDVVEVLTDSADPKQYMKKMRQRDTELNSYWGTICHPHLFLNRNRRRKQKVNRCKDESKGKLAPLAREIRMDSQYIFKELLVVSCWVSVLFRKR
jgi:hypothetical protein